MQKDALLNLRNLTKRFSDVIAVNRINLDVEKGEIFALLGPSGCGKTTTLRLIGGLEEPDEGEIIIAGNLVNDIPTYKRDSSIVFQNLALFPHMSVKSNIAFGLEQKRISKKEIEPSIREVLELMQLEGMEDRLPNQLSGGQQQRVALARSLVIKPEILLLDEPLASLDRKLRKEMQVELSRVHDEVGTTFLYVTHDQKVALSIAERMAVMKEGKLVQIDTPQNLYQNPRTNFVADFMGAINVFSGSLRKEEKNKVQIQTSNGMRILCEKKNMVDRKITGISVRPELIDVSRQLEDVQADNRFRGKVKRTVYQGDFVEVEVLLNEFDTLIIAHMDTKSELGREIMDLSSGEEVFVSWESSDSNILTEAEES